MVGTFGQVAIRADNKKFLNFQIGNLTASAARPKQGTSFFMLETNGTQYAFKHTGNNKYLSLDHNEIKVDAASPGAKEWFTVDFHSGTISLSVKGDDGKVKYMSASPDGKMGVSGGVDPNSKFDLVPLMHVGVCFEVGNYYVGIDKDGKVVNGLDSQFHRTVIVMEPSQNGRGQYVLRVQNGKLLMNHGGNVDATGENQDPSTSWFFEPWKNDPKEPEWTLSWRNVESGGLLTKAGPGLNCKGDKRGKTTGFALRDSDGIIKIRDNTGKLISHSLGNLMIGQNVKDNEDQFILEFFETKVAVRVGQQKPTYWSDNAGKLALKEIAVPGASELFEIQYFDDHSFTLKGTGYLTVKGIGGVDFSSKECGDKNRFFMTIINRDQLIPQCLDFTYVGIDNGKVKPKANLEKLTCTYNSEHKGYSLSSGGKFIAIEGDNVTVGNETFWEILMVANKIAFKGPNGKFWRLDVNAQQFKCDAANWDAKESQFDF